MTFEAYKGFNNSKLSPNERFFYLEEKATEENAAKGYRTEEYHPVRFVASFDIANLPDKDEFLAAFKCEEDDE